MDALPYTELDLLALNEKADALVPDVACCPILDPWLTVNAPLAGLISTSFAPAGFIVPVMLGLPQHHGTVSGRKLEYHGSARCVLHS